MEANNQSNDDRPLDEPCRAPVVPTDADVMCGIGHEKGHPGNELFKNVVLQFVDAYAHAQSKSEKKLVTQNIIDLFTARGIRFLRQLLGSEDWYVADPKVARDKIGNLLRYLLAKRLRTGTASSDSSFPQLERHESVAAHSATSLIAHFPTLNNLSSPVSAPIADNRGLNSWNRNAVRAQHLLTLADIFVQETPNQPLLNFNDTTSASLTSELHKKKASGTAAFVEDSLINADSSLSPIEESSGETTDKFHSDKSQRTEKSSIVEERQSLAHCVDTADTAPPMEEDIFDESELDMRLLMD